MQQFQINPQVESSIEKALGFLGTSLSDSQHLARCVLQLSNYFIQHPNGKTPWDEKWAQIAYVAYYLPLNYLRNQKVIQEGNRFHFFDNVETALDFGTGLTSAASCLLHQKSNLEFTFIERSNVPQSLAQKFILPAQTKQHWNPKSFDKQKFDLVIFSYSLTELDKIPPWALSCDRLMIVEPSTQEDGRKLFDYREQLLGHGYQIVAPCTHQGRCPLQTESKRDWCHDRLHFDSPQWFKNIEKHLPMKNQTLTMSYLLATKKPTQSVSLNSARTTGDLMHEKGKSRQLICRGENREFLAWLTKEGTPQEIPRGELIEIPIGIEKKSNELRVRQKINLVQDTASKD